MVYLFNLTNLNIWDLMPQKNGNDSVRGPLNSIPLFSRSCGYLFTYSVGPYVSYHWLTVSAAVCPLLCMVLMPFIAESPHYQVARGRLHDSVRTVQWLRGKVPQLQAEKEVNSIKEYINRTASNKTSVKDLFATIGNIRALYLSGGLLAFQQLSGVTVILLYTEPIFQQTGTSISASLSAIFIGITLAASSLIVPTFVKSWGFIKPMVFSAVFCSIFVGLLGLYFFLKSLSVDVSALNWMPVTCLFIYIISYTVGLGTLPWAVMGEMFPANTKSLAAGILTSFNFLLGFFTALLFVQMNEYLGEYWSFWIYALFCGMAAPFTLFLLPDTQGLSLDQIQRLINLPWRTTWPAKPGLIV